MIVGTDMSHDVRVWKEARTLAAAGHDVTVLAGWNTALPREETRDGVRIIRVAPAPRRQSRPASDRAHPTSSGSAAHGIVRGPQRFGALRGYLWYLRVVAEHVRWVRAWRPDVIHIHDSDRLLMGYLAHRATRAPMVYDAHEYVYGLTVDDSWQWKLTRRIHLGLERLVAPRAATVITVSGEIGRRLERRYGIKDVVIIHNFPLRLNAPERTGRLKAALPAEHRSKPVMLHQGRLTAFRGFEQFLETLALLPEAAGVMVGSGPSEHSLRELAARLGLGSRVAFIPQVPWQDLLSYTADADLGFSISQGNNENSILALPNKLFEYLMAGVPVVASDFPALREHVDAANVGILVPPNDPPEIARRIREVLSVPNRLQEMRQNALTVSQTKYNWEAQSQGLTDIYTRLSQTAATSGGQGQS